MDSETVSNTSPTSKKRSAPIDTPSELQQLKTSIEHSTPVSTAPQGPESPNSGSYHTELNLPNGLSRQASPATSILSSLSTSVSATPPPSLLQSGLAASTNPTSLPPAKRRKLTTQEREQKEREKAEKDRLRLEQKAKREEEKLAKAEEKRQSNEAKEEARRAKEMEKQKKDEEKRKKDAEKEAEKRKKEEDIAKRERAQSRINAFFIKPTTPVKSVDPAATSGGKEGQSDLTASTVELCEEIDNAEQSDQQVVSDYHKNFLPFALPSHSVRAPINRFSWDADAIAHIEKVTTQCLQTQGEGSDEYPSQDQLQHALDLSTSASAPLQSLPSMKQIITLLAEADPNGTELNGIQQPLQLLKQVAMKYIHFDQDVRPPYIGTYTKITSPREVRKTARNPYRRVRPDTDYDYDSEAEWEEVEEGEDLVSEIDSDAGSVNDSEEMNEFLDDEETTDRTKVKSRMMVADLLPKSIGIFCEDEGIVERRRCKLEVIQHHHKLPIDPFSTAYWPEKDATRIGDLKTSSRALEPARLPLQNKPNTLLNGCNTILNSSGTPAAPEKDSTPKIDNTKNTPLCLLKGQELEQFKREVRGSDLTKLGLLAILKKKFPKTPNAVLKDTLGTVAARVGKSEAEKRWTIIGTSS